MTLFKKIAAVTVAAISISAFSAVVSAYDQSISVLNDEGVIFNGNYAVHHFSPYYAKVTNITSTERYMEASIAVYLYDTDTQAFPGSYFNSNKGGNGAYAQVNGSSEYPAGKKYEYRETCSIYNGAVPYSGIVESVSYKVRGA